ncbi:MAG: hypothetical protein H8E03_00170 [Pelagibacteraceae bacterium]|nr:hypothetical protein [Pelagibacteraceae bacterium]
MNLSDTGFYIFDIRNFFDDVFVTNTVDFFSTRREFYRKRLRELTNDRGSDAHFNFVKDMESKIGKDYSYLYNDNPIGFKFDYKFMMDCFEYFDDINIEELVDVTERITRLSLLGFMVDFNDVPLNKLIDKINFKILSTLTGENITNHSFSTIHKHLNVYPKKSFMSAHEDNDPNRKYTIINFLNTGRKLKDGSLTRFFLPTYKFDGVFVRDFYEQSMAIDILPDYRTVIVFDHTKNNDIVGQLTHLVTKNKSNDIRFSVYNTYMY